MVSPFPEKDELMAVSEDGRRVYHKKEVVHFRTTSGEFGPLSNMAPDFPIFVLGVRVATAEALYQACRFPDEPEIQSIIVDQMSPMTAKMKSKKYRDRTRADWDNVRVDVMRWCLRIKLQNNLARFGDVLERTGERAIVEESVKDDFWGAKPQEDGTLVGKNVLGRLLMELRRDFRDVKSGQAPAIKYPLIPHFQLFGRPLEPTSRPVESASNVQVSLFDRDDSYATSER
jgi:ribA/ribD-fused uncharacterized protein